jgi:hypothetical protein
VKKKICEEGRKILKIKENGEKKKVLEKRETKKCKERRRTKERSGFRNIKCE